MPSVGDTIYRMGAAWLVTRVVHDGADTVYVERADEARLSRWPRFIGFSLQAAHFSPDTNVCTLDRMQLAGIPIRDADVFQLAGLLRTGGFEDVAGKLTHALLIETKVLALSRGP